MAPMADESTENASAVDADFLSAAPVGDVYSIFAVMLDYQKLLSQEAAADRDVVRAPMRSMSGRRRPKSSTWRRPRSRR